MRREELIEDCAKAREEVSSQEERAGKEEATGQITCDQTIRRVARCRKPIRHIPTLGDKVLLTLS